MADGDVVWAATDDAIWCAQSLPSDDGTEWREVAKLPDGARARCLVSSANGVLVGTSGAQVYRLMDHDLACDAAFAELATRPRWHTPWGGPPSIWTMCRGPGSDLWVNVHVGGLVRSSDGGRSWAQTGLDIDVDVHQICWDARDSAFLVASAQGFARSEDGESWAFDNEGLYAHYLRAVAATDNHVVVCASRGPRSDEVGVYRRPRGERAFERCAPADGWAEGWLASNIDAPALGVAGGEIAFGTADGRAFASADEGGCWTEVASGLPPIQSVLIAH
jgi:hypothetical protein